MKRLLLRGTVIGAALSTASCTSTAETCGSEFQRQSSLIRIEGVQSASGLAVADMDADGTLDIVVASGGDTQRGRVFIHYGKSGTPDWQSDDMDYNARVVAGDMNKDGLLDLAVALFPPSGTSLPAGSAKLYLSSNGELPRAPAQIIPPPSKGLYSPELALGDANGDGYLDLAVSTLLSAANERTPQFIYYNHGGTLDTNSPWVSETKVQANAVRFFDIDDDGLMDLIITAPTLTWGWVFKGYRKQDGNVGIATTTTPFELPSGEYPVALYSVDFDVSPPRAGGDARLFATTSNHYCATKDCKGFVAMYNAQGEMQWKSEEVGMASAVRNGALNADGIDDAVAGFWSTNNQCSQPEKCPLPGPLYAYCSSNDGTLQPGERLAGEEAFLVERLELVDLDGSSTVSKTYQVPAVLSSNEKRFVVTLPERSVMGINSIQLNGHPMPASHYLFTPGANWVAFAEPLGPGDQVEVSYAWASAVDIVIADDARQDAISVIYHR